MKSKATYDLSRWYGSTLRTLNPVPQPPIIDIMEQADAFWRDVVPLRDNF